MPSDQWLCPAAGHGPCSLEPSHKGEGKVQPEQGVCGPRLRLLSAFPLCQRLLGHTESLSQFSLTQDRPGFLLLQVLRQRAVGVGPRPEVMELAAKAHTPASFGNWGKSGLGLAGLLCEAGEIECSADMATVRNTRLLCSPAGVLVAPHQLEFSIAGAGRV